MCLQESGDQQQGGAWTLHANSASTGGRTIGVDAENSYPLGSFGSSAIGRANSLALAVNHAGYKPMTPSVLSQPLAPLDSNRPQWPTSNSKSAAAAGAGLAIARHAINAVPMGMPSVAAAGGSGSKGRGGKPAASVAIEPAAARASASKAGGPAPAPAFRNLWSQPPAAATVFLAAAKASAPAPVSYQSIAQANAAAVGGAAAAAAVSYCRKEKSLGLLCDNFVRYCMRQPDGLVCLEVAASHLGVERRRIYDVTNILEALDIGECCRPAVDVVVACCATTSRSSCGRRPDQYRHTRTMRQHADSSPPNTATDTFSPIPLLFFCLLRACSLPPQQESVRVARHCSHPPHSQAPARQRSRRCW